MQQQTLKEVNEEQELKHEEAKEVKTKEHECACGGYGHQETKAEEEHVCACEGKNKTEEAKEPEVVIEEKDELQKAKEELEDWKQSYLRKQADFQNFTKRKEKEIEELRKYSSEKIITKFLGSFDNLERAVDAAAGTKDFEGLLKGVEMIIGNLKDIMKSEGVEEVLTNGECDPVYHHAVNVENSDEHKDNEIVRVLQKGYIMKGKVIRPAMVSVCKK